MILLTTSNIFFISHKMYVSAIMLSAAISTMWSLNVKDLAIANWGDRLAYIIGGVVGTASSLYGLRSFFESF